MVDSKRKRVVRRRLQTKRFSPLTIFVLVVNALFASVLRAQPSHSSQDEASLTSTASTNYTNLLDFAVYATGTGCGAITLSSSAYIDSFDSTKGSYSQTKQLAQGIVGVSGNVNLSGSSVINGPVFTLHPTAGNCSNGTPGITISGQAKITGGYIQLTAVPPFPIPPPVVPGSHNYAFTSNSTLPPGNYGNIAVSNGKTLTLSPGTYNVNSISLSGGSILTVSPTGVVTINVAGSNVATPINFSGGSVTNPSGPKQR